MKGTFAPIKNIKQIQDLRKSVGWRPRTIKKWQEIIKKSSYMYSVWENEKLIGMGRMVEDGAMCIFYDLVVRKEYQNQGIGKKIMRELIRKIKNKKYVFVGLFPEEKKSVFHFYNSLGFKVVKGMALKKIMF